MLLSPTLHPGIRLRCSSIPLTSSSQNLAFAPPRASSISRIKPEALLPPPPRSPVVLDLATRKSYGRRNRRQFFACAAAEAAVAETPTDDEPAASASQQEPSSPPETQGKKVVKAVAKPRLVLKFIWMEKNIGLALDQSIPGHGAIPLSPYYFWPRKDAWEELKVTLESKPWISQKTTIILLNQATDVINLWQQSGGALS